VSITKQAKKFADAQIQAHGTAATAWGKNLCLKCFDGHHKHCLKHGCDCLCQRRGKRADAPDSPQPQQLTIEAAGTVEIK
jgi:hypothetical protein